MPPLKPYTMHSQRNAGDFLERAEEVGGLMPKARKLLQLRRILQQALPPNLARSCSVANAGQGKIVLFAGNSVIAAKLKLLAPALRDHFVKCGVEATSLVVQVQAPEFTREAGPKQAVLSDAAAESLRELSAQLPDSSLKEAVASLAARASRKPGRR
jgi:hypothetical protein